MKVITSGDQLELRSSGLGQFLGGILMVAVGIVVTVLLLGTTSSNGKKAPVWSVIIGVVFVIFGVVMVIFAKNRSVVMRKGGDTTVRLKRVFGGTPQQQSVPTASIVAVRLSTFMQNSGTTAGGVGVSSAGNPQNSRRSVLSLVLNNNDLIEVGASSGTLGGLNVNGMNVTSLISKAPLSKEANEAANFLGVPLQADDTSSIAGAVRSLKNAFEGQGQPGQVPQPGQPPTQTASFNPDPQAPAQPQAPQAPAPPAPQIPQQPASQPIIPTEVNPGGQQTPPPPYTPPPSGPPQQ